MLSIDQEVTSSITGTIMGFFCSGELFHHMYGMCNPVFQCPLTLFSSVLTSLEGLEILHQEKEVK